MAGSIADTFILYLLEKFYVSQDEHSLPKISWKYNAQSYRGEMYTCTLVGGWGVRRREGCQLLDKVTRSQARPT